MGLFSALGSILGIKDADDLELKKEDITWLADLFKEVNRTDIEGPFGGYAWDGNTQRYQMNPDVQPAYDRFMGRMGGPATQNPNAGKFSALLDATMAQRAAGMPHSARPPARQPPTLNRPEFEGPPPDILEELRARYG